jgi:hypothetical protein
MWRKSKNKEWMTMSDKKHKQGMIIRMGACGRLLPFCGRMSIEVDLGSRGVWS